jgi:5-dehydro-4-deoxyglucarate dehydratase
MQMSGVLFFPVTPFDAGGAVAASVLADHVEAGMRHEPGGVFAACGTGEFAALSGDEQALVVQTAVKAVDGRAPVIAGAGGSLPHAIEGVRRAADAGADGVLLLPPYLVTGPPGGLVRYVAAVADASAVPIIVYQRANARFTPAAAVARLGNVTGFKDGLGDVDRMHRIVLVVREAVGDGFQFFNGMPTAEMTVPAYRAIGVDLYSSAVFCFAPQISTAFYRSLYEGDGRVARRLLSDFYRPFVELRDRVPGYAVALVMAAVRASGLDVGPVRPPLVDPSPEHLDALHRIVAAGLGVIDAG